MWLDHYCVDNINGATDIRVPPELHRGRGCMAKRLIVAYGVKVIDLSSLPLVAAFQASSF